MALSDDNAFVGDLAKAGAFEARRGKQVQCGGENT